MSADCQYCGACCFSDSTAYVPLSESDQRRLANDSDKIHVEDGKSYMRMQGNIDDRKSARRCIALRLVAGRFVCGVYHSRPDICRELERGSPACLEEVDEKKARALRVLA